MTGGSTRVHLEIYELLPPVIDQHPLFGLGLNTFSSYYEFVTGKSNWGPHSYYVALLTETGIVGDGGLPLLPRLPLPPARSAPPARPARSRRPASRPRRASARSAWGLTAALVGNARRERLLPDDADVLLLRARDADRGRAGGVRAAVKVVVLTTSYPRHEGDHAGRFIADAVERLRERGIEIEVLAPGAFDDFGLAYGDGVPANLRQRPWAGPLLLGSMALAARRAARGADLVHAHWLPAGAAAAASGKPFVVTLHGSDVELAKRAPWLARPVLRARTGR